MEKNDLNNSIEKIEAKSTGKQTYTLKKIDLKNLVRNATLSGKVGVLYLDFAGDEFVILRRKDFERFFGPADTDIPGGPPVRATTTVASSGCEWEE